MRIRVGKLAFSFPNWIEFLALYAEIFLLRVYAFKASTKTPFIVDCGAHMGMSTLYFKSAHPGARIIAFEPNPRTFQILKKNIEQNNMAGVTLVNAAVSDKEGELDFFVRKNIKIFGREVQWSWSDTAVENYFSAKKSKTIRVPTVRLSRYLTQPVDLLKLDIEGMEERVLKEIEPKLSLVKEIILEFHGSARNPANDIHRTLALLRRNAFRCTVKQNLLLQRNTVHRVTQLKNTHSFLLMVYARRYE